MKRQQEALNDVVMAARSKQPLQMKCTVLFVVMINVVMFVFGLMGAVSSATLLYWSDSFFGNQTFVWQAVHGLQVALAASILLCFLSILGIVSVCRLSTVGLCIYFGSLTVLIIIELVAGLAIVAFSDLLLQTKFPRTKGQTLQQVEVAALDSFLNTTYFECCVEPQSPREQVCKALDTSFPSSCRENFPEFKDSLANRIASARNPLAIVLIFTAVTQLYLWFASCISLCRIRALADKQRDSLRPGFSEMATTPGR